MKVAIKETKTGREKLVEPRFAKILTKLGRHEYLTRDMASLPSAPVLTPAKPAAPSAEVDLLTGEPDIEKMDLVALHAHAAEIGITLHPQTGVKKVRAAILAHRAEKK